MAQNREIRLWDRVQRRLTILAIAYGLLCLGLFWGQRYLIFRPVARMMALPSDRDFQLPYEDVRIPIGDRGDRLDGWWIPAPNATEPMTFLPDEPSRVLKSPKIILYLCGIGGNKSYVNSLARVKGLRQLGFGVLLVDYRGYGQSKGDFPSESQVYEDSQAAWNYLTQTRRIPAHEIVLYGESFGGAIALDLATKHPEAGGLIAQSTFISMAEMAHQRVLLRLFPIDFLLTQRFESLQKARSLKVPVLFIHGTADDVVPAAMSQQLYAAAPEPKMLFLVPNARHFDLYQPGDRSYLKAIQRFTQTLNP